MNQKQTRGGPLSAFVVLWLAALAAVQGRAQNVNVIAWGDNRRGQCNVPVSATNVVALAAAQGTSLALRADGSVVSWGRTLAPDPVLTNAIQIAAGYNYFLALKADGTIVAWGFPQAVPAAATNVVSIAVCEQANLALRADGSLVEWGNNGFGLLAPPGGLTNIAAFSVNYYQGIVVHSNHSVTVWGQYGTSHPPSSARDIFYVSSFGFQENALHGNGRFLTWDGFKPSKSVGRTLTNLVCITGGYYSPATLYDYPYGPLCAVLNQEGSVQAWGSGPATTNPPNATNLLFLAASYSHCLAITSGPPIVRGVGAYAKQVSVGNPLPLYVLTAGSSCQWFRDNTPLPDGTNAYPRTRAVLGYDNSIYSVVVSNALGVVSNVAGQFKVSPVGFWGADDDGQGEIAWGVTNPVAVSAGAFHGLALNGDGTVVAWGKNASGQTNVPPGATNVIAVAAGGDYSLALRNDGSVLAWGRDWDGQSDVPNSANNVVAIAAGWAHSVALRSNGTVVAWGNNDVDQTVVPGAATNVNAIAAGYYHTLALRTDHKILSWGLYNDVPNSASNGVAIAAGANHNLVLRSDGTVVAWGDNTFGQTNVPANATNIIAIAAGYYHSLALRADGALVAWGRNGNGVTEVPPTPGWEIISAGEDFNLALPASARRPSLAFGHRKPSMPAEPQSLLHASEEQGR